MRGRFFAAGEVRLAILSLLSEAPKHGYELIKELEARSGGLYRVSAGTIYPTLQLLEDEGLVVSRTAEGKRVYQLTDAGRAELEREQETVRKIWERASRWGDWAPWIGPQSASVAAPLGAVAKAAFRAATRAGEDRELTNRVVDILDRARRELDELGGTAHV
jgi:DNA-binding PadR family transcriptional regulator